MSSAREYSHKRFLGRPSSSGAGSGGGGKNVDRPTIDSTPPPRVVTPTKAEQGGDFFSNHSRSSNNGVPGSPMLHKPTVNSGGLTHASPLRPSGPMRYSLQKGSSKQPPQQPPPLSPLKNHRRASAEKLQAAQALVPSSKVLRPQDPNAYKIFLLLLQPQSKIFELIQLIYSPNNTTIGNILQLIPDNATEPALGSQSYIGLCRPKSQEQLLDTEQLASEARPGVSSAKISLGEILVAIPEGFSGADVASLSKQILANPKIVKLLKRADPLAPKNKRRSSRRQHRTKTRAAEQVHVLEKHDELEEEAVPPEEAERRMKEAMEHAAAEAAAANAAIPGGGAAAGKAHPGSLMMGRSQSIHSIESSPSMEDFSQQESLDDSFSSWSKSFDASFSAQSSICSGVSKRVVRRKDRQARRMRILQRSSVAALCLMVVFYMMDPQKDNAERLRAHEAQTQSPMGFMGILQCLFLLLTLYKVERLVRTTHAAQHYQKLNPNTMPSIYMSEDRACPFLKASASALKKFKSKYGKRLKRSLATGTMMEHETSRNSSSNHHHHHHNDAGSYKLRSFSLKAAAMQDLDTTDTGSL